MTSPDLARKRQKAVVFVALLLFAVVLFLIQLWLFVLVLEHKIAGKVAMALPAACGSVVLFGINLWMLRGVQRLMKTD